MKNTWNSPWLYLSTLKLKNYEQVCQYSKYIIVMKKEIKALQYNQTMVSHRLTSRKTTIGDGIIERHNAGLVTKGYT